MEENTPSPPRGPAKLNLNPRKAPHQSRGRDTIEAILKATGAQIEQGGLDKLTTRRIAQEAGISVGALYEYFPNKESIVLALTERWMDQVYDATEHFHPRHGITQDVLSFLNKSIDRIVPMYREQPILSAITTMITSTPELRLAAETHNRRYADMMIDALTILAPTAPAADIAALVRTFPLIGHTMISEAYARHSPHPEKLIEHLKICTFALASRLLYTPPTPGSA